MEIDRHFYQNLDSGYKSLPCFSFKIRFDLAENVTPYKPSSLGYQGITFRILLDEFQIAMPRIICTHIAQFSLQPICIGQTGMDTFTHQRIELHQR